MTIAYDASFGLHAYKKWRLSLKAYDNGTMLKFVKGYTGVTQSSSIKPGELYKVVGSRLGYAGYPTNELVRCKKDGSLYKRSIVWTVEGLARGVAKGEIEIVDGSL